MTRAKVALVGPDNPRLRMLMPGLQQLLREAGDAVDLQWVDSDQAEAGVEAALEGVVAVVPAWRPAVTPEMASRLPDLKLIQLMSAGSDYLDKQAFQDAGVAVANNGGGNAVAVAEHSIWLMVAVYRRLDQQIASARSGRWWGDFHPMQSDANDLTDKTVGIVGLGRIGSRVARRLQGWECRVIYNDILDFPPEIEQELEVTRASFDQVIEESDVVTLHVPLERTTRHMVSTPQFKAMKKTAILINACRGPVVDEAALIEALRSGEIRAAGLDVMEVEPIEAGNPLLTLPNVVLTPHLATRAIESTEKTLEFVAANLTRLARGEAPESVVPPV